MDEEATQRHGTATTIASHTPREGGTGLGEVDGSTAAQIICTEYECMRTEIGRYQDHQKDLVQAAFVTFAAVLALIGALASSEGSPAFPTASAAIVLLLAPVMFGLLAWTYFNRSFRVVELAQYVAFWVSPLARRVAALDVREADATQMLHWETFKCKSRDERSKKLKSFWPLRRLPERLESISELGPIYLTFIVPSAVSMVSYWKLVGASFSPDNLLLTGLDLLVLASCMRYMVSEPRVSSEERGLKRPAWIDELLASV